MAEKQIQLTDLLNMDMGAAIEWLESNAHKYQLLPNAEEVETPEDVSIKGEEVLCYDGCDWSIDYVEVDCDTGTYYMANGTEIEAYMPLPKKPF